MIRLFFFIPCILGLFFFIIAPGPLFAKEYCIAMITWRGETIAEKGFIDELNKSTYDIVLTKYNADQDNFRLQKIITQIQSNPVDIIYVFGTTATKSVLLRIKDTPVVFNIVSRPVGSGIIASWESSKNNATGASNKVSVINQLKTLKKVINYKKLGIIYNPKEQNSIFQRNNVKRLENLLNFSLKEYRISRKQDILKILPQMKDNVDAVFLPADSMIKFLGKEIMEKVNGYKIPSLSSVGSMVPEDSVLLGFVPKYYELGRIAAQKAILILNGRNPSDIPSSVLDHYHISVNMKTARIINIQIPMSLLVMANQIVR
ncbi:ABC transporter substrate-binding protein [Desulfobacula sp.]|uniref:ABC transporter substrate-binding protein n=1 Tax=Desulfobacula sp. TaxID=2593537 RepID=UPI00263059A9|nr:ABC transporter substrate-binding protein [Desulfobacula sp.]